ncbi:hypothetical protein B0H11DRAFT_1923816 [Mycena galericulata]|nr:hypothetical protein B0H11DRAFT_1923816 [Mycena galericulata]
MITSPAASSSSSLTPSSSATRALPEADLKLAQVLHVLAVRYGDDPRLGPEERQTIHHREALKPHFHETHGQQKFVLVLQALVTICTSEPGQNNVAAMVALSTEHIKLFICQNGGRPFRDIKRHLKAVWNILQELCLSVEVPLANPEDPVNPPRLSEQSELDLMAKLIDISYSFVAKKVLRRVKKRLPFMEKLLDELPKHPSTTPFQEQLVNTFSSVVNAANLVKDSAGGANTTQWEYWSEFRTLIQFLYNMTISIEYKQHMADVDQLQDIAKSLGKDHPCFDLKKSISKAVKVEAAALTLCRFAISPHRRWIAGLDLHVESVRIPPKRSIRIQLDDLDTWRPAAVNIEAYQSDLCKQAASSTNQEIFVTSKTHSECELVARVVDNNDILAGLPLIPYVCCSKLHCFSCYLWLEGFNQDRSRKVAHDGSHGGVKPGWLPPSLEGPNHHRILTEMRERLEELRTHTHEKKASALSTSSDPATSMSHPNTTTGEQLVAREIHIIYVYASTDRHYAVSGFKLVRIEKGGP